MQWTTNQTELTTAATDLLLAGVAVFCVVRLLRRRHEHAIAQRAWVWSAAFGCLAVAGGVGSLVHGVALDTTATDLLWPALHLCLGLALAAVGIGVVVDLIRHPAPGGVVAAFVAAGIGSTVLGLWDTGSAWIRGVFGACVLSFALIAYAGILVRRREAFAAWMLAGVLVSSVGAALQAAGSVQVRLLWSFDHNGVFHLIQIVGMVLLLAGVEECRGRERR